MTTELTWEQKTNATVIAAIGSLLNSHETLGEIFRDELMRAITGPGKIDSSKSIAVRTFETIQNEGSPEQNALFLEFIAKIIVYDQSTNESGEKTGEFPSDELISALVETVVTPLADKIQEHYLRGNRPWWKFW